MAKDKVFSYEYVKKAVKLRKYANVIEASHWSLLIRKLTGCSVLAVEAAPGNRAQTRFSVIGFFFYLLWNSLYIYCAYIAQSKDQTILRNLYQTKLKRYGDDFERMTSLTYVLFTMWLNPFHLSGKSYMVQLIIDLDKLIQDSGEIVDYTKIARTTILTSVGQIVVYLIRMFCIWIPIYNSANQVMPAEKMFQVVYSDSQAIILTSLFCYYIKILRERFIWINKTLEIKMRNCWEYKVFSRGQTTRNIVKVAELQERHICEKIRTCARVYSMLFNLCEIINGIFGFAILITMIHYVNYIILYLFYFMEATASGLFHDVKRYVDFLVYSFWEIAIAIGVIYLIVYFCESVMREAKNTAYIVHEIINGEFNSAINREAVQLSLQLLHEKPVFKVMGLFELNYEFLQQSARSVVTHLTILLQFATENSQANST